MVAIIIGLATLLYVGVDIHHNINRSVDSYGRDRQCQTSEIAYYADAKDISKCKPVQNP